MMHVEMLNMMTRKRKTTRTKMAMEMKRCANEAMEVEREQRKAATKLK